MATYEPSRRYPRASHNSASDLYSIREEIQIVFGSDRPIEAVVYQNHSYIEDCDRINADDFPDIAKKKGSVLEREVIQVSQHEERVIYRWYDSRYGEVWPAIEQKLETLLRDQTPALALPDDDSREARRFDAVYQSWSDFLVALGLCRFKNSLFKLQKTYPERRPILYSPWSQEADSLITPRDSFDYLSHGVEEIERWHCRFEFVSATLETIDFLILWGDGAKPVRLTPVSSHEVKPLQPTVSSNEAVVSEMMTQESCDPDPKAAITGSSGVPPHDPQSQLDVEDPWIVVKVADMKIHRSNVSRDATNVKLDYIKKTSDKGYYAIRRSRLYKYLEPQDVRQYTDQST